MNDTKLKILYIAGLGRSGSTFLAKLLGEVKGFINVGEAARYFLNTSLISQAIPCSCGSSVSDCLFWKNIARNIERGVGKIENNVFRLKYLPLLMSPIQSKTFRKRAEDLLCMLKIIYTSIAEKTGCDVIVDSSKHPSIAYGLAKMPGVELYVVHLVRDLRGVVYSWSKPKEYLPAFSPLTVVPRWIAFNLASELLRKNAKKYFLVYFGDLVRNPKDILVQIINHISEKALDIDFLQGTKARVNLQHALAGNPDKRLEGILHIKEDTWYLPWHIRLLVSVITYPLIYRYHYLSSRTFTG